MSVTATVVGQAVEPELDDSLSELAEFSTRALHGALSPAWTSNAPGSACCRPETGSTLFGRLCDLGGLGPPETVGELRSVLRARRRGPGSRQLDAVDGVEESSEIICVGGRQLPDDDDAKLKGLAINLQGYVGSCFQPDEDFQCCPPAVSKELTVATEAEPHISCAERLMTLWILLAALAGIGIGQIPGVHHLIQFMKMGSTNMLTGLGMILMLLPPFAAAKFNRWPQEIRALSRRIIAFSLFTNWLLGPALMLALGILVLHQYPNLLEGVIFVGAARCIAMVLIWVGFAGGDEKLAMSLVLLNSIITVFVYGPEVALLNRLCVLMGIDMQGDAGFEVVLTNVMIYLCVPMAMGIMIRSAWHAQKKSAQHYEICFLPLLDSVGLGALLWTVTIMFAEMSTPLIKGEVAIADVGYVAIPLLTYFATMFGLTWLLARKLLGCDRKVTVTLAFTAASNNFELALAATSAIFGPSTATTETRPHTGYLRLLTCICHQSCAGDLRVATPCTKRRPLQSLNRGLLHWPVSLWLSWQGRCGDYHGTRGGDSSYAPHGQGEQLLELASQLGNGVWSEDADRYDLDFMLAVACQPTSESRLEHVATVDAECFVQDSTAALKSVFAS
eukprot:TRINITY_DN8708_c0_g1_i2.p1 TRINITY_DN8708_c0_g1~~TRINITY_DN8708_c0_g1_i2.p1  ORF type:complete len:617 (+),score=61.21 TRINITY_DN8708_c0_g1_i2:91-1941(+)